MSDERSTESKIRRLFSLVSARDWDGFSLLDTLEAARAELAALLERNKELETENAAMREALEWRRQAMDERSEVSDD